MINIQTDYISKVAARNILFETDCFSNTATKQTLCETDRPHIILF